MARIIIFGGAFNPPTLAHEEIIKELLALPDFDEIWVMPSNERADKHIGTPASHRLAMLRLTREHVFNNDSRLKISDFELKLSERSETVRMVKALINTYPQNDFWFVYGSDSYRNMPNWTEGDWLRSSLNMILIERGEHSPAIPSAIHIQLSDYRHISSTSTRSAEKELLTDFVNPYVARYIRKHKLYD